MIRAQYIRFKEAVMTPGRAGNTVGKMMVVVDKDRQPTLGKDEVMDEIAVGDVFVMMRSARGVRFTHVSNIKDFEPMPEPSKSKKEAP